MKEEQLIEIIVNTKEWYDNKIEELKNLSNQPKNMKIEFQGENGKTIALPDVDRKAFMLGISIAIEVIGEFPVNITATKNNADDED